MNDDLTITIKLNGTEYNINGVHLSDLQNMRALRDYMMYESEKSVREIKDELSKKFTEEDDSWVEFTFNDKNINVKREHLSALRARLSSLKETER